MSAAASGDEESLSIISLKNPNSPFKEHVDIEFMMVKRENLILLECVCMTEIII